jgi:hypothetical protein
MALAGKVANERARCLAARSTVPQGRRRDVATGTGSKAPLGCARRASFDRIGIDRLLGVQGGRSMLARAAGCGRMYGADSYNYLRFAPADVTPEAACLDAQGSIDIGRTEVMF